MQERRALLHERRIVMFKKTFGKNSSVERIPTVYNFAKFIFIFGIIVAVFSAIFVLGIALICEVGEEEKVVVTLIDKKVDRGLVRVGAAAVGVRKYIYVLDDEGYKFEKTVSKKFINRLNGGVIGVKYRLFGS